jgi:hypothetical protein
MSSSKIYKGTITSVGNMKAGTALTLYVVGALALVVALILTPAYTMFTGEIFILMFIVGLILSLGLTIRQTQKLATVPIKENEPASGTH